MATQLDTCPECGDTIPGDASTLGLCPKCLIRCAMLDHAEPRETEDFRPRRRWTAPAAADLQRELPGFEVHGLIGQSGMGAVYRARHLGLGRTVALKIVPRDPGDPEFEQRFEREARTLGKLNHPNIVSIHDHGQSGRYCYIAMELVEGQNLRQVLRRRMLAPDETLAIALAVCEGLGYAHRAGVVHRDIKPENILLEGSVAAGPAARTEPPMGTAIPMGKVKIADFGLARMLHPTPEDFTLTTQGQLLGTPLYMAPEQLEHPRNVDHRVDLYALGVMLYEMLTGELPLGRFDAVTQKAPVDPRLDAIVLRCLENDPRRRYSQVAELQAALAEVAAAPRHGPRVAGSVEASGVERPPRRFRITAKSIAMAAAIALAVYLVFPVREGPQRGLAQGDGQVSEGEQGKSSPDSPPAAPAGTSPEEVSKGPDAKSPSPNADAAKSDAPKTEAPKTEKADRVSKRISVELDRGRVRREEGQIRVQVDYVFCDGTPSSMRSYYLVVESPKGGRLGTIALRRSSALSPIPSFSEQIAEQGTIEGRLQVDKSEPGPFDLSLEFEETFPGRERRRISNILSVKPVD
jgi:serine/threonine protein kinase